MRVCLRISCVVYDGGPSSIKHVSIHTRTAQMQKHERIIRNKRVSAFEIVNLLAEILVVCRLLLNNATAFAVPSFSLFPSTAATILDLSSLYALLWHIIMLI